MFSYSSLTILLQFSYNSKQGNRVLFLLHIIIHTLYGNKSFNYVGLFGLTTTKLLHICSYLYIFSPDIFSHDV